MLNEIKYLGDPSFRLNADDSPFAVGINEIVNGENIRTATTDAGFTATVESIGSNLLLSQAQPSVIFLTIGIIEDTVNVRFLKFNFNTTGNDHKIVCLYANTNIEYDVLLSSQVTGGLNFSKDNPIHSIRIVNGLLYWTDNLSAQRRINIDAAIKLNNPSFSTTVTPYTTPLAPEVITVLRKPPLFPLTISKFQQTSPALENNFIENSAFQFSYRYYYRDGEKSVPGAYSLLAPYNIKSDLYNRIDILVPLSEYIEQDVQSVDILVKYGNENTFYEIKSWDKNVAAEAAEIVAHNAGTTALSYSFYNDTVGEVQDEAYSLKPFDSVPILSETLEIFDNRLGFANNLMGYDTPSTTSLDVTLLNESDGATPTGRWVIILYGSGASHYFLDLGSSGFFDSFTQPTPYPASVDYATLTYVAAGPADFATYVVAHYSMWSNGIQYTGYTSTITSAPSPISIIGARCYKSGATYKLSTTFYDFGDRKCGSTGSTMVSGVSVGQASMQIPDRAYGTISYVTAINWSLSNADALNEIPSWATHYSVNITKCLKTRFFLQARSKNSIASMTYVNRDSSNVYTFTTSAYAATLTGVGIDITNLQNFGMGYIYADGDVINIYISGNATVFKLKITAQSGRWLICELQDLGTLDATTDALFEIYTPYTQSIYEPYYEVGQIYEITAAGTSGRQYSNIAGSIRGDVTLLDRNVTPNNYLTENMSPNDKYYLNWYTDVGRPNFIDRIGQQLKENDIVYSNVLLPGTRTNGLSSFDALDAQDIPTQCGAIMKLQVTSKVQGQLGIVMLAICAGGQTASMYIGEVQLYGSNLPSTLAQAPNVIGTINILKGSRGTINPESVVEFRGDVFWADVNNHKWVQYSINGLDDICYKTERFWNLWFQKYNSMTWAEIEALGGRPFIFTTVDPYHRELLISIPKLSNIPPKGYLPDYPSTINYFDILDYQAKTMVYKLGSAGRLPHWQGAYTFYAENFITLQNKLYSFKNGLTYIHNQTNSQNNFYGVQYTSKIMCVSNMIPQVPKVYNNTSVQANVSPVFVYMYNNYPYQQSSDIMDYEFTELEGIWYANIKRNKLVPNAYGYTTDGLLTGEKMRNTAMWMMYEFSVTTTPLELRFIQIGMDISSGHTNQLKP